MKRWLVAFAIISLVWTSIPAGAYTLSGTVTGGDGVLLHLKYVVAVPARLDTFHVTLVIPFLNTYSFSNMDSGGYVIAAFQDLNANFTPDLNEPRGFYGGQVPTIFQLSGDSSGVVIELHPPNTGGFSGRLSYDGSLTGTTFIYGYYHSNFDTLHGGSVLIGSLTGGNLLNNTGNGPYTALVDSFTTYYVKAFMDLNGNFQPDADEPQGIYGGTTPAPVVVQRTNFPDSVNIVMSVASASPERPTVLARGLALDNAYPNPFNSEAVIPFSLERASTINLTVFDILGRPVRVLAQGRFAAGSHSITFSAADLPSGAYLVRLQSGESTLARRVFLVR